jgi:hypothetical protein
VVDDGMRRQDRNVLEPVVVWMVQLEVSTDDIEGTLELGEDALRFAGDDGRTRTIPLADVTKVKKIIGSPVLMVHSTEDGSQRHTAFYFRKPPPLKPDDQDISDPPTLMFGKGSKPPSKRKQRRANASYLATASTSAGEEVRTWWKATRAAVDAAKGR